MSGKEADAALDERLRQAGQRTAAVLKAVAAAQGWTPGSGAGSGSLAAACLVAARQLLRAEGSEEPALGQALYLQLMVGGLGMAPQPAAKAILAAGQVVNAATAAIEARVARGESDLTRNPEPPVAAFLLGRLIAEHGKAGTASLSPAQLSAAGIFWTAALRH